jgi:hypothetical protein
MSFNYQTFAGLSVAPLAAGDLIDRAVRFYRAYFKTFLFIAAVPVIIGTVVSVAWHYAAREIFTVGSRISPAEQVFYYLFLWLGTIVIWFTETVATLAVMGGSSRNFVRHLLFAETISFRSTYRNTWSRLGGLILASSIITVVLGVVGIIVFYIGSIAAALGIMLVAWALSFFPVLAFLASLALGMAVTGGAVWLFFLLASRFAYVPQVMLVEGRGAFSAIGRSASLASGNVKRLVALFFFTLFATYSALALFYVPLAWYAWVNGIDFFGDPNSVPATFEILTQLVYQASLIFLSPVWMIGLCLLYVDERVRHEGYDIELAAARRLGDIPDVPADYINPLQPALVTGGMTDQSVKGRTDSTFTTLNLR